MNTLESWVLKKVPYFLVPNLLYNDLYVTPAYIKDLCLKNISLLHTVKGIKNLCIITCCTEWYICSIGLFCFFKIFIHLFMRGTARERGRNTGWGRSRLPARSLMWDSILDSGIMPWAKGRCSTTEPSRHSNKYFLVHAYKIFYY